MTIGIIVALRWEAQCLKSVLKQQPDSKITWQLTGMGPQAAADGARQLIANGATQLISYGCAAGLQLRLEAGSLLAPQQVIQTDGEVLECDVRLWQWFSDQSGIACHDPLAEVNTVLSSTVAKSALRSSTGAAAADMESAAIMRAAKAQGVPAAVLRTVLDDAEQSLPAGLVDCCDAWGSPRSMSFAAWLLREPKRFSAVYALARAQRQARHTLVRIAKTLVRMS